MEIESKSDSQISSLGAKMNVDPSGTCSNNVTEVGNLRWKQEWCALSGQIGDKYSKRKLGTEFLRNQYSKESRFLTDLTAREKKHLDELSKRTLPKSTENLDKVSCIWSYTRASPIIFSHLNDVLYSQDKQHIANWDAYVYSLCRGLELLPLYWGQKVYRVVCRDWAVKYDWKVGKTVRWFPFTSCSKDKGVAMSFSTGDEHVLFEIISWTGRDISPFSAIPDEDEVLFRCVTDFMVTGVSEWNNKQRKVTLEEFTNIKPGFDKILLWVDDNPENNRTLLEASEANEINIVIRKTTDEAIEFIQASQNCLSLIRIVSDMKRLENGKDKPNAGAIFLEKLFNITGWDWKESFIFYVGDILNTKKQLPSFLQHFPVYNDDRDVKDFLCLK